MGTIDYAGDPRSFLMHIGNKNSGRYPRGSGDRPFQHIGSYFGKRKYQNPDGTLTPAGQARFESEKRKNALKKKENRVKDEEDLKDPSRWAQEDAEAAVNTSKATENLIQVMESTHEKLKSEQPRKKYNLESMSDDELRKQINRMQMESQFEKLMNEREPNKISKGTEFYEKFLKRAGSIAATTTSALTLALAIKKLAM